MNKLYFGDNFDWLPTLDAESIDLIYLDPPFNSQAQYNVLFQSPQENAASAQVEAFRDTWTWGDEAEWNFKELMKHGGAAARILDAFRTAMGESDMMAYLTIMALRLRELHRTLKPSGSLYLHCDPNAAHYLKVFLDALFGPNQFTNEIVWKRTSAHNDAKRYSSVHDTILFYSKSKLFTWNPQFEPYSDEYISTHFVHADPDGRLFRRVDLRSPHPRPNLTYDYTAINGITYKPHANGWAVSHERMRELDRQGRLFFPKKKDGRLRRKLYLDESQGVPLSDTWTDIKPIFAVAAERLGYPTQKPLALLERIIAASSNRGDVVLDPFCGCGTTIEAAERSGRRWIGIDVAIHAVKVIEGRLAEQFGGTVKYDLEGIPRDFESAVRLAQRDKYQFQWWANYLFNPHALREQKKGADRGIDGELFFPNGPGRPWGRMLTSVKGGEQVGPAMVRDFARVLEREHAQLGLFICLYPPTREMVREAASVRFADVVHGDIPKLQIVSIDEWFKGKMPLLPPLEHLPSAAFGRRNRALPRAKPPVDADQPELPLSFVGGKAEKGVTRHFNPQMVDMTTAKQSAR